MLRQSQINRIQNGLKKAHDLLAGDYITHVSYQTGTETQLLCIFADLDQESYKGIQIDPSGVLGNAIYEVQFEKENLEDVGITISEADHFIKDGKRLDFAKSESLKKYLVPICAIHNFTIIRLIDSTQFESESGEEWDIV